MVGREKQAAATVLFSFGASQAIYAERPDLLHLVQFCEPQCHLRTHPISIHAEKN